MTKEERDDVIHRELKIITALDAIEDAMREIRTQLMHLTDEVCQATRKTEPTISKMEQVEDEPMKTTDYCDICKRDMCEYCIADATNPYCVPSHYEINYEPKDEPKTQTETQNSNLTFEKRTMRDCYNCKKYETEGECVECHYEPKDEPQTDCAWK